MRKALIIGCDGQDGKLLYDFLISKNYSLIGIDLNLIRSSGDVKNENIDITDFNQIYDLISQYNPDEIYYLAAFHHSSQEDQGDNLELFRKSHRVHVVGLVNCLEAVKRLNCKTKLFYAASSLIFGDCFHEVQDETSPYNPDSIYGITKMDGLLTCRFYRNNYDIFASVGIFYNHESFYRKDSFLSKKIIKSAWAIKNKTLDKLVVGDISAVIDWGYAPEYIEAVYKIIQLEKPDDFIIASGEKHTVAEFIDLAFGYLNLDWKKYVIEDKKLLYRHRKPMVGNITKLYEATGWKPKITFAEMIKELLTVEGAHINE